MGAAPPSVVGGDGVPRREDIRQAQHSGRRDSLGRPRSRPDASFSPKPKRLTSKGKTKNIKESLR